MVKATAATEYCFVVTHVASSFPSLFLCRGRCEAMKTCGSVLTESMGGCEAVCIKADAWACP